MRQWVDAGGPGIAGALGETAFPPDAACWVVLRALLPALLLLGLGGQFDPLLPTAARPMAPAAPPQELPQAGDDGTSLEWPALGETACDGHCILAVPDGVQAPGGLWVLWNGSRSAGFVAARERGGDGAGLVAARPAFDAVVLDARAGDRIHLWGRGDVALVAAPAADGEPNLVALAPGHLGWRAPGQDAAGCLPEDVVSEGARCLRFSSGVANTGDAALWLRSQPDGSALVQRLGGGDDRAAGSATFHATHGHFHYTRFMAFTLHPVGDDGLRGASELAFAKTGFCMVDWGPLADAEAVPAKTFWRQGCQPTSPTLRMGVNPGWYDLYRWLLPEQALDVSGLAPGRYELVVEVDPDWTVRQAHRLDDRASVVFDWDGAAPTVVQERGLYRVPTTLAPPS